MIMKMKIQIVFQKQKKSNKIRSQKWMRNSTLITTISQWKEFISHYIQITCDYWCVTQDDKSNPM